MAARTLEPVSYLIVYAILFLLVLLNVGVSFIPMPGVWHVTIGVVIATVAACLIVLFGMHAAIGPRLIWVVVGAGILWIIVLFSLTLADYFTRGLVPFTPGH